MKSPRIFLVLAVLMGAFVVGASAQDTAPLDIGSRLELFVDHYLIDTLDGAALKLHHPQPAESVLWFDEPWEGRFCGYVTVIQDGDRYLCYYRGRPNAGKDGTDDETTCLALSVDGIHWAKTKTRALYGVGHARKQRNPGGECAPFAQFLPVS